MAPSVESTAYYFLIYRVHILSFGASVVPYPCHNGAESGITGQHKWD